MNSFLFKSLIIGVLVLLLLIPTSMVNSLVNERMQRRNSLIQEMSGVWGSPMVIHGAFISSRGVNTPPEECQIKVKLDAETRRRGIYKLPFYTATLFMRLKYDPRALTAKDTMLKLIVSNSRTLRVTGFSCNREQLSFYRHDNEKQEGYAVLSTWVAQKCASSPSGEIVIAMTMHGMDKLHFVDFARKTEVSMQSNWKDPSFGGAILPAKRIIGGDGFQAEWSTMNANPGRDIRELIMPERSFGVSLFVPVDIYAQTDRSIKYALLFIGLTFLTFFVYETLHPLRLHPMQYLLVGLALSLFYLLLLSLSEYFNFFASYMVASSAIIVLIGVYSLSVLRGRGRAVTLGALLAMLYAFLYIMLQLEEYSLVLGSTGLFLILAAVMYVTRNIDWYGMKISKNGPA